MEKPNIDLDTMPSRWRGEDGFGENMYYAKDVEKLVKYIEFLEAENHAFELSVVIPSHIDARKEAKKYGDGMNNKGERNGFHELDFYNGTVWLRSEIEGNEA